MYISCNDSGSAVTVHLCIPAHTGIRAVLHVPMTHFSSVCVVYDRLWLLPALIYALRK